MAAMTYDSRAFAAAGKMGATAAALDEVAVAGDKPSLFSRLILAMQESRMRKAEIETRRVRAILEDADPGFRDALLPFKGE